MADVSTWRVERGRDGMLTLHIPGMTTERLTAGRKAVNDALRILNVPKNKDSLKMRGIELKDQNYYLAIAIKESSLKSELVSGSNAKGLFQMKTGPGRALDDVNKRFGTNFKDSEVFYNGPDKNKKEETAKNNSMVGILYWHLCRDIYRESFNLKIPEADRDKAAAFFYKIGPGDFANLWETLNPKSFEEFSTKLSEILIKEFPKRLTQPKTKKEQLKDPTYNIDYT